MDNGEGVNRRVGSGQQTVVNRDSLRNASRGTASNGIPQVVAIHNSLSTTACTSVDNFAIIHALLNRVVGYANPVKELIATLLTWCPARRCTETFTRLSFCGAILKYITITNLFLRCHSHKASFGLNKSRVITAKLREL